MPPPLLDLRRTDNPHRWCLPISKAVSVGPSDASFMFGGIGLAAAIAALERTCSRPVVWATAQYLSFARIDSQLDLHVVIPANGRETTQARVIGYVGEQEILSVSAALGDRPGEPDAQWPNAPHAPSPQSCRLARRGAHEVAGLRDRLEVRIARGRYYNEPVDVGATTDGRMALWMRSTGGAPIDAPMLAIMADHLTLTVNNATGGSAVMINSLDNTIRFTGEDPTDWVLCEIQIDSVHRGFAHGAMHIFSQRGKLLAVGSQSMIIRRTA